MLHFIVPYPPGGVVDVLARELQRPLQAALDQPVIIENVPGAAGAIGLQRALAATDPGATIAFGSDSDMLLVPLSNQAVRYRPKDFRLLGLIGTSNMVLVTGSHLAAKSLRDLLTTTRQSGAKALDCGDVGVDSNMHLIAQNLARQAGIPLLHVPYKGIAPLVQDLMGGHLDMAFLPYAGSVPGMIASGRLHAIGVAAPQPLPSLPGVPTIASVAGLASFDFESWSGIFVARRASAEAVDRLAAAMRRATNAPAYRTALTEAGVTVAAPMSLDAADRFFSRAQEDARKLVATAHAAEGTTR